MSGDLPSEQKEKLESLRKEHGLGYDLYRAMNDLKQSWKKDDIRVALVGESRIGKSSHINAHLRDKKAASVSATDQCTMETKYYPHPDNKNLLLFDTPGLNTNEITRGSYENYLKVENFDFFLSLTKDIIRPDVRWLSEKITGLGKRHYIVRTHIDESVKKAMRSGQAKSKEEAVELVRKTLRSNMEDMGITDFTRFKIYLVDNDFWLEDPPTDPFEFEELRRDLTRDSFEELRQDALMHIISGILADLLAKEKKSIGSWIWKISGASAVGAMNPIPGGSAALDIAIIVKAVLTFYGRVGLRKKDIKELELLYSLKAGSLEYDLQSHLKEKYPIHHAIREEDRGELAIEDSAPMVFKQLSSFLLKSLGLVLASEAAEDSAKVLFPVIGFGIAALVSYITTAVQLEILQKEMEEIAEYAIQRPSLRK